MYTEFYNLDGSPFRLTPDHRFYYDARPHKKALAYLTYGISRGEGFIVITGEVGAGKTTLVDHILSTFVGRNMIAVKVVSTLLDAENMLRIVADTFGVKQEGVDKATIFTRIQSFLIDSHRLGKPVLLFIDEAQNLPHSALEELRMLSNVHLDGRPLLQIYLLGQPEFRQTLAGKELEQLRQRVITSYHLGPLNDEETRLYIDHRLRQVGWNGDPNISDQSYHMIYEATGGLPRKVNLLCDRIFLHGFIEGAHDFDAELVGEVIRDMSEEGLALAFSS